MLCAKFAGNWPSGSGEEDENVKNLQTDGRTTDDQKSSVNLQLRWAKKITTKSQKKRVGRDSINTGGLKLKYVQYLGKIGDIAYSHETRISM